MFLKSAVALTIFSIPALTMSGIFTRTIKSSMRAYYRSAHYDDTEGMRAMVGLCGGGLIGAGVGWESALVAGHLAGWPKKPVLHSTQEGKRRKVLVTAGQYGGFFVGACTSMKLFDVSPKMMGIMCAGASLTFAAHKISQKVSEASFYIRD